MPERDDNGNNKRQDSPKKRELVSSGRLSCCLFLRRYVCFVFVFFAFTRAAALRSIVLCSSICMRPDSHMQLPNNCLRPFSFLFLPFFLFLWTCRFFRVFFSISAFSLYVEYVVRSFLPDGIFLPCDHGLDF